MPNFLAENQVAAFELHIVRVDYFVMSVGAVNVLRLFRHVELLHLSPLGFEQAIHGAPSRRARIFRSRHQARPA
jgi:hypothetical protein